MGSGWCLLLLGCTLLLHLDVPVAVRVALLAAWLADAGTGLYRLGRRQAAVFALVLLEDGCFVRDRQGNHAPVTLQAGSVLLQRIAWLRCRCAEGGAYSELFLRDGSDPLAWRRLQVLWRWGHLEPRLVNDK